MAALRRSRAVLTAEDLVEFLRHLDRVNRYLNPRDRPVTRSEWMRLLLQARRASDGLLGLYVKLLGRVSGDEQDRADRMLCEHNERAAEALRWADQQLGALLRKRSKE